MESSLANVGLKCNVQINTLDRHGKVIKTVTRHNKATVMMVDGILRYLQGDFTGTERGEAWSANEASPYLPTRIQFGRVGVKRTDPKNEKDKRPHFNYIDVNELIKPTFVSSGLQEPIDARRLSPSVDESKTTWTITNVRQTSFTDNNNGECLEFRTYIDPKHSIVGFNQSVDNGEKFTPYAEPDYTGGWSYFNPSTGLWETMMTEVGLVSSSGVLLARVLFDGEVTSEEFIDDEGSHGKYPVFKNPDDERNPIVQTEETTVVIIWRIGILSVGDDDEFVTQSNVTNVEFAKQLSQKFTEYIKNYVTDKELKEKLPASSIMEKEIQDLTDEIITGMNIGDLKGISSTIKNEVKSLLIKLDKEGEK